MQLSTNKHSIKIIHLSNRYNNISLALSYIVYSLSTLTYYNYVNYGSKFCEKHFYSIKDQKLIDEETLVYFVVYVILPNFTEYFQFFLFVKLYNLYKKLFLFFISNRL